MPSKNEAGKFAGSSWKMIELLGRILQRSYNRNIQDVFQKVLLLSLSRDGRYVKIGIEQDPGQAGVSEADYLIRSLQGFIAKPYKTTKDKITRASPVSSQAEAGNIKVLQAPWNDEFFRELENFPDGAHDDIVDALSGAFNMLTESTYDIAAMATM